MDKIKRDKDGIIALEDVPAVLDAIIDWINAHDASIVDMIKTVCPGEPSIEQRQSYVRNCYIKPRKNCNVPICETNTDGITIVRLDGYAIVPREEYELSAESDSSSIEQELESGLIKCPENSRYWIGKGGKWCTRIFLPAAKYNAYAQEKKWHGYGLFHDIPVFSVPGLDKIVYCTD